MAFAFIAAAHADMNSSATLTVNVPTGTADDDIIFAYLKGSAPFTPPSGWTFLADTVDASSGHTHALYYRMASSEPASYDWTASSGSRFGVTHVTYRDGFDTADPIDVVSDTGYVTSNTTLRAASMSVAAANSPLIFLGGIHASSSQTFTPATNPATFVEDVDTWNGVSRFARQVASVVWTGSGATGDMDATISVSSISKHAFAVALNPAAAGGGATTDIAADVASLVLAAPQSTVILAPNVSASVAALVLSAPASVVSLARNIAGNTAVLVLTAPQSDVDLAGAIQAIAGSLVLSALQSTITLSPSVAANPGALVLTSPQHQVGTNFDVAAVAGTLALTGQQATIALAAAIQAAVATLALNSPQSIVSLQQTVAAAVAGLVLTPQQAAVALAGDIDMLPGNLTLAGLEALIVGASLGLQIDPTRVLLVDPRRPYAVVTRRDDAARIGPR